LGPNSSACRTPVQAGTGCGGLQRSGPTGGTAKGIPLNTRISEPVFDAAAINPVSILMGSLTAADAAVAMNSMKPTTMNRRIPFIGIILSHSSLARSIERKISEKPQTQEPRITTITRTFLNTVFGAPPGHPCNPQLESLSGAASLIHHERAFEFHHNCAILIDTCSLDAHQADVRTRFGLALL